jgi:hypothetical protein
MDWSPSVVIASTTNGERHYRPFGRQPSLVMAGRRRGMDVDNREEARTIHRSVVNTGRTLQYAEDLGKG